jgi:hypothetical protein
MSPVYDQDNKYHLPSNKDSSRAQKLEEERFRELKFRQFVKGIRTKRNTGNQTVLLASGVDGRGEFDWSESDATALAAESLMNRLLLKGIQSGKIIRDAHRSDVRSAIVDPEVANIFLLGHASYHTWLTNDGPLDWYDLGNMTETHLKSGIFGNLGCGNLTSWREIPLGNFVVGDEGMLIGKRAQTTGLEDMVNLDAFSILAKQ